MIRDYKRLIQEIYSNWTFLNDKYTKLVLPKIRKLKKGKTRLSKIERQKITNLLKPYHDLSPITLLTKFKGCERCTLKFYSTQFVENMSGYNSKPKIVYLCKDCRDIVKKEWRQQGQSTSSFGKKKKIKNKLERRRIKIKKLDEK